MLFLSAGPASLLVIILQVKFSLSPVAFWYRCEVVVAVYVSLKTEKDSEFHVPLMF